MAEDVRMQCGCLFMVKVLVQKFSSAAACYGIMGCKMTEKVAELHIAALKQIFCLVELLPCRIGDRLR